jgi:hypothetical protein
MFCFIFICLENLKKLEYSMRTITTCRLFILNQLFEAQKYFFRKILALDLYSRASYYDRGMVSFIGLDFLIMFS